MKIVKRILLILLFALIVIQFFRPDKNLSADKTHNITNEYPMPADVQAIMAKSCNDCHSNHTDYPWYASVQPVAWWLADHIKEGKRELNFDAFTSYRKAKQYHKLEEAIEQVKEKEMPLSSYTIVHTSARLTDAERATLTSWFQSVRDTMQHRFPADSLVIKRKS